MTKPNLTKALAELNMCKQYEIKPNFSELSRKTGIDRHTLKKYYENGGKFDKERSPKGSKYDELRKQGKAWMNRYNSAPRMVLKLKSPNQAELDSLKRIMESTGEVRCPRLLKCLTSADN